MDASGELPQFLAGRRDFVGELGDLELQPTVGGQGRLQGLQAQPQP